MVLHVCAGYWPVIVMSRNWKDKHNSLYVAALNIILSGFSIYSNTRLQESKHEENYYFKYKAAQSIYRDRT